jgi:hypothetical protein
LIDASAIPDNERFTNTTYQVETKLFALHFLNISLCQMKKGARAAVNQSELESYERLKDSLIPLFENPESLPTAKQKISQVLDFWRVKGKVRKGF